MYNMDAINQMVSVFIFLFTLLGWLGIAMILSGLAILIYRVIRMALE